MTSVAYGIAMPANRGVLGAPIYCAQASAFFQRLASQPSAARKALYNTMISALVSAGVWSKLDTLYMFAAADQATALTNLVSASFGATAVGTPTFTTDQGFTGATGKYVDSNFNPSTAGGQFQQNSASAFAWGSLVAGIAGATIGNATDTNSNPAEIYPRYVDNTMYGNLGESTESTIATGQTDGSGLRALSRTAGSGYAAYKGAGTLIANVTAASTALANKKIAFFVGQSAHYYTGTVYCGGFGAGLSGSDVNALYGALHPYLQAVAGLA